MINVILNGALGRMGQMMCEAIAGDDRFALAARVDRGAPQGGEVLTELEAVTAPADVLIDFSHHSAAADIARYCAARHMPAVIATTGQTDDELAAIHTLAHDAPVFLSANMSIGVALLCELSQKAASVFPQADIEIVETHHDRKLDVPSGTALLIARRLGEVREGATFNIGRHENGLRPKGEIGIHSLRLGNEVGRHEVIIATGSETITLTHKAESRALFAQGALAAAAFLQGRAPGLYDMRDMLAE